MKKATIGTALFLALVVSLRRFGPELGRRAMKKCEEMMEHMPEDSPPKRIMHSLEEIREQNIRILSYLEKEHGGGRPPAGN